MSTINWDELWKMLVETVHTLHMYKSHKRYVADVMIKETPTISPQELSAQLNIPLGEAVVLLDEVRPNKSRPPTQPSTSAPTKTPTRSLLDFSE